MTVLVTGAGGFIGGHVARALLDRGDAVRAVDIKPLAAWHQLHPDADNRVLDCATPAGCREAVSGCSRVYNFAADMGGMGFIESHKAACMLSVLINTHLIVAARDEGVERYFFASSACVYPGARQRDADAGPLAEAEAYPADPEDGYGWEKLFSERMCRHFREDFGLATRVARYHNVYGPHGTWDGGREKAPAAICRKIAIAKASGHHEIDIWGDGEQVRSFMHVDDWRRRDIAAGRQRRRRAAQRRARTNSSRSTRWSRWSRTSPGYACGDVTNLEHRPAFARATATTR